MSGPAILHPHFQQFLKVFGAAGPSATPLPQHASQGVPLSSPLPLPPQQVVHLEERVVVDTFVDTALGTGKSEKGATLPEPIKLETIGLPKPTSEAQLRLQNAGFSRAADFDNVRAAGLIQAEGLPSLPAGRPERPSTQSSRIQFSLTHRSAPDLDVHEMAKSMSVHGLQSDAVPRRILDIRKPVALDSTLANQVADIDPVMPISVPPVRAIAEISQLALAFGLLANADLHKRWPVAYFDPRVTERSRIRSLFRKADDAAKTEDGEKDGRKGLQAGKMIGISGPVRRIFERLRSTKMARGKKSAIMLAVSSYAAILDVIAQELVEAFSGKDKQDTMPLNERRDRI